jgi:hypothetical protein
MRIAGVWSKSDMNDIQHDSAKSAAIGAVVGIVIGLLAGGRYDLKPDKESGLASRVDSWTGNVELFGPNGQPITQQQTP